LAHSVKAIYGADFEARKYLRRFFDRVFVFPDADRGPFIERTFEAAGIAIGDTFFDTGEIRPQEIIQNWADSLRLSNRDIVQITDILSTFVTSFEHECVIEPNYLLALATAFYVGGDLLFRQISAGGFPNQSIFNDWTIAYVALDASTGRKRKSGSSVSNAFHAMRLASTQTIEYFLHHEPESFLTAYVQYELNTFHPSGYPHGNTPVSVLPEYPSRVRNAGRVIDRK
jgi:hypothetical protein